MSDPPALLASLHLLRPGWLALLLLAPLPLLLERRRQRDAGGWRGVIAPHLLAQLRQRVGSRPRLRPATCAAALFAVLALALSGPSWRRVPSPLVADQAPMVVALDLSRAGQPALAAGKRKIRDLVALRAGARTGLIAYAGTAHAVLPPTDDPRLIETYLDALAPDLMPRDGSAAAEAAGLARRALDREAGAGTILLVTPAVPAIEAEAFRAALRGARHAVQVLATGAGGFEGVPGATVVRGTPDGADVARIAAHAQRHFTAAPADDPALLWQDAGLWVAFLALPLALFWARRGALAGAFILLWLGMQPAAAEPGWFAAIWLTPDQRARLLLERGDPAGAAALFTDPLWRGIALYRAGDYAGAAAAFALRESAAAQYNRGNALMMLPRGWNDAIPAYDLALQRRPDFPEARDNRAIALAFQRHQQAAEAARAAEQTGQAPPAEPGETALDPGQSRQPAGPPDAAAAQAGTQGLSDEEIEALWMRRVGSTPADLLRLRFSREAGERRP
jgi:Ca-activated chloride channel family protein